MRRGGGGARAPPPPPPPPPYRLHTGTLAQARADEEQFYVLLRAVYDKW